MKTSELETKIRNLQSEIDSRFQEKRKFTKLLKEEYLKLGKVEGLAKYIKFQEWPLDIFDSFGMDHGDVYDSFGEGVRIKVVYNYCYTDIRGLSEEEFEKLKRCLSSDENK